MHFDERWGWKDWLKLHHKETFIHVEEFGFFLEKVGSQQKNFSIELIEFAFWEGYSDGSLEGRFKGAYPRIRETSSATAIVPVKENQEFTDGNTEIVPSPI